jgi:DNA-binding IclR family transcriptional regulator
MAALMAMATSKGYVDDKGALIARVRRIAAPVYGAPGQLVAALAAVSLSALLEKGDVEPLIVWLKDEAAHLSNLLKAGN